MNVWSQSVSLHNIENPVTTHFTLTLAFPIFERDIWPEYSFQIYLVLFGSFRGDKVFPIQEKDQWDFCKMDHHVFISSNIMVKVAWKTFHELSKVYCLKLNFKKFSIKVQKRHNWLVLHDPQPLMIVLDFRNCKNASKILFSVCFFLLFSSFCLFFQSISLISAISTVFRHWHKPPEFSIGEPIFCR